jgi:hypothetical protein
MKSLGIAMLYAIPDICKIEGFLKVVVNRSSLNAGSGWAAQVR